MNNRIYSYHKLMTTIDPFVSDFSDYLKGGSIPILCYNSDVRIRILPIVGQGFYSAGTPTLTGQ